MTRQVSYWLVPAASERAFFQELIRTLANVHRAPVFDPHVTLYSGESPPDEVPQAIIERATPGLSPVRLRVDRILATAQFTKTLFVQFHPLPLLDRLTESLRQLSARPSDYVLNPHLSLMYKHMDEQAKQRLAASLQLPMTEVWFDEVWAHASPGATRTEADVARWEIVGRQRLVPPA